MSIVLIFQKTDDLLKIYSDIYNEYFKKNDFIKVSKILDK